MHLFCTRKSKLCFTSNALLLTHQTNIINFLRALSSFFQDKQSCTFTFPVHQRRLLHQMNPNSQQNLMGFLISVKSLRSTFSKLTPATLFWTYLIVEVLWLNWLTKMWRNYDTRNKEIVLTGLFTLKDIDLEGGFTTSRFDTQLWDISETWKVLTVIFYLSLIERSWLFCC